MRIDESGYPRGHANECLLVAPGPHRPTIRFHPSGPRGGCCYMRPRPGPPGPVVRRGRGPEGPLHPLWEGVPSLAEAPPMRKHRGGGRGCLGLSHTKKGRLRRGACPRKFAIHGKWAPFLYPPSSRPRGGTRRVGFMLHRHVFPTQEVRLHLSTRRVSCSRLLPGGGGSPLPWEGIYFMIIIYPHY